MTFRIEFYAGQQKLATNYAADSLGDAVRAAREGLLTYNARFANIFDLKRNGAPVEMVHRDVVL